jgi:hypothetical protein
MMQMIRAVTLLLLAGVPAALSGCFLFTGDDEKDKSGETAAMDASGAPGGDPVHSTPPSPWKSIELEDESGAGSDVLPIVAIVLSGITLGLGIVYGVLHRRRRLAPPV